jgi:hypothetical protein
MTYALIAILVMAPICVIACVSLFFRKKDKLIDLRKDCVKAATILKDAGLDHCSALCACFSVGDVPGVIRELKTLIQHVHDAGTFSKMVDGIFTKALPRKLALAEGLAEVLKGVSGVAATTPEVLAAAAKAAGLTIALLPK